jgi:hypothetical protein
MTELLNGPQPDHTFGSKADLEGMSAYGAKRSVAYCADMECPFSTLSASAGINCCRFGLLV